MRRRPSADVSAATGVAAAAAGASLSKLEGRQGAGNQLKQQQGQQHQKPSCIPGVGQYKGLGGGGSITPAVSSRVGRSGRGVREGGHSGDGKRGGGGAGGVVGGVRSSSSSERGNTSAGRNLPPGLELPEDWKAKAGWGFGGCAGGGDTGKQWQEAFTTGKVSKQSNTMETLTVQAKSGWSRKSFRKEL